MKVIKPNLRGRFERYIDGIKQKQAAIRVKGVHSKETDTRGIRPQSLSRKPKWKTTKHQIGITFLSVSLLYYKDNLRLTK